MADERDAVGIDDVVATRREDHDARCRADEPRIDVDGKRLYEPLFGGVRDGGCRGRVRARALPGFIGIKAALDAPAHGRTRHAAQKTFGTEGAGEDEMEDAGNAVKVIKTGDECDDEVRNRHEGDDERRERCYAL